MISPTDIISLIRDFDILGEDTALTAESDLFAHGLDSIALMQLLLQIEQRFGLAIAPADITKAKFASPAAIAAFLTEYANPPATP